MRAKYLCLFAFVGIALSAPLLEQGLNSQTLNENIQKYQTNSLTSNSELHQNVVTTAPENKLNNEDDDAENSDIIAERQLGGGGGSGGGGSGGGEGRGGGGCLVCL